MQPSSILFLRPDATRRIAAAGALALALCGADARAATVGEDALFGTPDVDRISALGGDDLLAGQGADDTLFGGSGDDTIYGDGICDEKTATCTDTISDKGGNDSIKGGAGDDTIYGGYGRDVIFGGSGDDEIRDMTGPNNDIHGGAGEDVILATGLVAGGAGDDRLLGFRVSGGSGDDVVAIDYFGLDIGGGDAHGGSGQDFVRGWSRDDVIYVRDGERDAVSCDRGNDVVVADELDDVDGTCERVDRR